MTKITEQAHKQALAVSNIRTSWLCRDKSGVVIAVKAYRAEAHKLYKAGGCADFYCPCGPVCFVVV